MATSIKILPKMLYQIETLWQTQGQFRSEHYLQLLKMICTNQEVKAAFIFCCYTGLRWVNVKKMEWADIREGVLTTRMIQAKNRQFTHTIRAIVDLPRIDCEWIK